MRYLRSLDTLHDVSAAEIGGKARSLAQLQRDGYPVAEGICLPVSVYRQFLAETGLARSIHRELNRKPLAEMRWEEIWDTSLRIRNHFLRAAWPAALYQALSDELETILSRWSVVAVRSSAPAEDAASHSFAGLHDSRVMVRGREAVLEALRAVWASLWSDGALLYRRELGLDPDESAMAVLIQEMVVGDRSGVLFSRAPNAPRAMMIEAVWGLNQGLVDGSVAPDRWLLDHQTGVVVEQQSVERTRALLPTDAGPALVPLDPARENRSPLEPPLARQLHEMARQLELERGAPVDIEWTVRNGELVILQVRPISAAMDASRDDQRPWYLSLHRSLPALELLQEELEREILPAMMREAATMAGSDLSALSEENLCEDIRRRQRALDQWEQVYHEKCIPMAHGIRLFGEFYTELMSPDDPYAFLNLLRTDGLLAVERNRRLQEMAVLLRRDPELREQVRTGPLPDEGPFVDHLAAFVRDFGALDWIADGDLDLASWLCDLAAQPQSALPQMESAEELERRFLAQLQDRQRPLGARMLRVARASYALRDNDNIYLGRIRAQVRAAENEAAARLTSSPHAGLRQILTAARRPERLFARTGPPMQDSLAQSVRARSRQLVGQPAVAGVARGVARVLDSGTGFKAFRKGEVLVCDAIEPNMTFLAPLAAAIVERRGGMLIHGAIIAREYGIPCVTGVPDAAFRIHTGDNLTVDGYLGLVTVDHVEPERNS